MYFIVNNDAEGEHLIKILNSSLYTFLIKICQWGNFRNEQKVFSYLKYPKITININSYFKLSDNEIALIN